MAMDFVAGCIGGCAGVVVGHPFDTIKVKLQTQDHRNPLYKNSLDCFRSTLKSDSVSGLFRGMSSPMAGVAVVNAIVFGVQGNIQRRMPNPESLSSHFISGTAAGLAQSFICSPMELVKTRIQLQEQQVFKNPWHCLRHIYKTEGIRGVFRGIGITAAREGPGFGTYFLAYAFLTRCDDRRPISTLHMLLAGGAAGSFSWFCAYPMDVVKTRYQVDGMSGTRMYKSSIDCLIKSVKAEGVGCLCRGMNLSIIRAFPVNAATWAAVTWVFRIAGPISEDDKYPTFSELKDATAFLPELNFNRSFCVGPSQNGSVQPRLLHSEVLGRSSSNVCQEDVSIMKHLLRSVPGYLLEM